MLNDFISLFFPNCCVLCQQALVKGEKTICLTCDYDIPKTDSHLIPNNFITKKFYGKVHIKYSLAYYLFTKSGLVQRLLHQLKYNNVPEIGLYVGQRYGQILKEANLARHFDVIVPVPLHHSRKRRRGYNQSSMFGEGLSDSLGIPLIENMIRRNIKTDSQTSKTRLERWHNVSEIFQADPSTLNYGRVLLVDDVITTGATLEACAATLISSGCSEVSVAAIAAAK